MAKKRTNEDKKPNMFIRILVAVVLPFIITVALTIFVLQLFGVDVLGWTEEKLAQTPIISSFVKTEDEKILSEKLDKANETIETQKKEIEDLKAQIEQLEAEIENKEMEIAKFENEKESLQNAENDAEDGTAQDVDIKKLASSFKKMDKEQAAQIIANMDIQTAVLLLSNVSSDVRGAILEEMEPQQAANIMQRMMN